MILPRVVFDPNILLSALLFGGNPGELFNVIFAKRSTLLTSPSILSEFAFILRNKFGWADEDIEDAISTIGYAADLIKPVDRIRVLEDDPDNRVLECAVEGKADFIVSGDRHLLALREYRSIPILKAAEFLDRFR